MLANFGERLKNARKMAGLSMEALAKKAGALISKQAIGKYEKGKMKPSGDLWRSNRIIFSGFQVFGYPILNSGRSLP
ncbi:MAG: helix-turn-helix transcriptional regulator [Deltaproteobacteria bacterium]|nr:helix-turn-helix transcriptional regulator [Deltaproteobacteria bacterium]